MENIVARKLIESIKKKFFEGLDQKTNWGKEQVKIEYTNAVAFASLDLIDEELDRLRLELKK